MKREVPQLVNPKTGRFKKEVTVSLGTKEVREGKRRDLQQAKLIDELFERAEALLASGPPKVLFEQRPSVSAPIDLEQLEAFALTQLLGRDEFEREHGDDRRRLQSPEERRQWPDLVTVLSAPDRRGMEIDHFEAYGGHLESEPESYRKALARRDPAIVLHETKAYLKRLGVQKVDPSAPWFREACLVVLSANVKAFDAKRARQAGDVVPTPKPPEAKDIVRLTMAEAFELWKAGSPARGAKRPSENTVREAKHAVRRFNEMFPGRPLTDLTRGDARAFRDALARVPTRLPAPLRKLPMAEVLKAKGIVGLPPPHVGTVNKSLTLLAAIISHAEAEGAFDALTNFANPFGAKGIKLAADDREGNGREVFDAEDLRRIFSTPVYSEGARPLGGGGEAAYWLPLIALFSGARQGEIASLRICDLKQDPETGIWHFDIATTGGRTIKNKSSRRKVPVHPALERIGLLRYRQFLRDSGNELEASLWPDVQSDSVGRTAGPWSKWFNRYLRDTAGVEGEGKVFHCFRHTFKRMAPDTDLIKEEKHDALTGHSSGRTSRKYGHGIGMRAAAESMAHVPEPTATKGLVWQVGAERAR